MSRAVRFAPLVLLVLLLAGLVWRLATPTDTNVPSKLEGKLVPAFALPAALPSSWAASAPHTRTLSQPKAIRP